MGKYDPLAARFAAAENDRWTATFAEVEGVLGAALPKAARADEDWWRAGGETPHGAAWRAHGWSADTVDTGEETVTFAREAAAPPEPESSESESETTVEETRPARSINAVAVGAGLAAGAVSLLGLAFALRLRNRR